MPLFFYQHKDIKKSSHSELKTACEEALKALQDDHQADGGGLPNGNGAASPVSVRSANSMASCVLPEPNPSRGVNVETFFLPFELACRSKTPKIVCTSLDSIEKLVAYGHISYEYFASNGHDQVDESNPVGVPPAAAAENEDGTSSSTGDTAAQPASSGGKTGTTLFDDHLTSTVANCFTGPSTDEGVQVQVLKALLSIVTSGHIRSGH